jgi:TRAP-type mannitol/chloroaromatic compound transport system permease small subunit
MIILLQNFSRAINNLNEWVGRATSWLTGTLVLVVCFDVVARKIFNFSKIWIMDIEWHLFSLIFLLSAGFALKHNKHVRVDLFYEKFSVKEKAAINFWGNLLFLIPWCCLVIYFSFGYAMESLSMNEGSPEPGGLPMRFIIKFCITIGIGLLLLQALAGLIESGIELFSKPNEKSDAVD